jgi:hypothetical protein
VTLEPEEEALCLCWWKRFKIWWKRKLLPLLVEEVQDLVEEEALAFAGARLTPLFLEA